MELLEFAGRHPFLTVFILIILCGSVVETAKAIRGSQE